jgi:hypothetical protein
MFLFIACPGAKPLLLFAGKALIGTDMPRLVEARLPADGRQSETALLVARGTRRLLRALGLASVVELALPSGRRADIVGLAADGTIVIVEIKSSLADFRADTKWPDYRAHCDRLYFAVPEAFPLEVMPSDAGLIVTDGYEASILREGPDHRLAPATRRSLVMRFAQTAADRLHNLSDPDGFLLRL